MFAYHEIKARFFYNLQKIASRYYQNYAHRKLPKMFLQKKQKHPVHTLAFRRNYVNKFDLFGLSSGNWGEFNVKEQRWRKAWVEKFGADKV